MYCTMRIDPAAITAPATPPYCLPARPPSSLLKTHRLLLVSVRVERLGLDAQDVRQPGNHHVCPSGRPGKNRNLNKQQQQQQQRK